MHPLMVQTTRRACWHFVKLFGDCMTSVKRILAPALHLHRMASGVSLIFPCQVYQLQSTLHSCAGARAAGTLRLYRATTHGQPGDCLEGVQLTSALQKAYG